MPNPGIRPDREPGGIDGSSAESDTEFTVESGFAEPESDGEAYVAPDLSDPLVHPGEILMEEVLLPNNISQAQLARGTGLAPQAISEIINRRRSITADVAIKLGDYLCISPMFFLRAQNEYDVRKILKERDAPPSGEADTAQSDVTEINLEGNLGVPRQRPAKRLRF